VEAVVSLARQLVYDSRAWSDVRRAVRELAALRDRLDLADVNWRRLTPLRQALIHACNASDLEELRQGRVRIVHGRGDEALAWLAIGWMSAQLGWPPERNPPMEESHEGDQMISVSVGDVTAALNGYRVLVTRGGSTSFAVGVPQVGAADAVAAELRDLGHDNCLRDALSALIDRFQR
jgi:glucose-6-phosphate dehydrogenase assembly protein OpcA